MLFYAHVDAIEESLARALPQLRRAHGETLTIDEIRNTIGTRVLLNASTNASLSANIASIRGTKDLNNGINIQDLYERALEYQRNPPFLGEGI